MRYEAKKNNHSSAAVKKAMKKCRHQPQAR